jgi:hypothetical protein
MTQKCVCDQCIVTLLNCLKVIESVFAVPVMKEHIHMYPNMHFECFSTVCTVKFEAGDRQLESTKATAWNQKVLARLSQTVALVWIEHDIHT